MDGVGGREVYTGTKGQHVLLLRVQGIYIISYNHILIYNYLKIKK